MKRIRLAACIAWLSAGWALAGERVPRPEFSGGYGMPKAVWPGAGNPFGEWLDVSVLVLCLAMAAYFALVRRSRRGMAWLTGFCLVYFGFVRQGCVCSVGSFQNVAEGLFNPGVAIPGSVICFFVLPLLAALLFGRVFCAAVCPLGAIQELVARYPRPLPRWATECLTLIPRVFLGLSVLLAATGTTYLVCRKDPFVSLFRFSGPLPTLLVGFAFLAVGVVIARPYCRFVCPYGVLVGWMSRLSWRHLRITPDDCVVCGLCEDVCPVDAIRPATAERTAESRGRGVRGLVTTAALLPVLVALGTWGGGGLAKPLLAFDEDTALLAQLKATDAGKDPTNIVKAFQEGGRTREELEQGLESRHRRLALGGRWLGAFLGLVVGVRLLSLRIRLRRSEYEPDRIECVSCGRCFASCPRHRAAERSRANA